MILRVATKEDPSWPMTKLDTNIRPKVPSLSKFCGDPSPVIFSSVPWSIPNTTSVITSLTSSSFWLLKVSLLSLMC
ncbi:Hypothetical protein NTJ_03072 [Nesidiocoris tenuis]|uniref:Uncharacterized protein n=1 Tax=Nesidiocoris tenuis TaxID=355587 RepID=A0ABN7ADB8_9HEMI|nr:Hypothetical protein NTJ_03072 [Nesidiocoris tenuis]